MVRANSVLHCGQCNLIALAEKVVFPHASVYNWSDTIVIELKYNHLHTDLDMTNTIDMASLHRSVCVASLTRIEP